MLPGIEYESGLTAKSTLDFRVGSGLAYVKSSFHHSGYGIFLNLHAQYRYYYNFQNQLSKGKNIKHIVPIIGIRLGWLLFK